MTNIRYGGEEGEEQYLAHRREGTPIKGSSTRGPRGPKKSSPIHSLFTQIFKFQYSLIQNIVTDLDSNFTLDHINDLDRVWHRPRGVPYGHHGHNPSIFSHRSDDIKKPTSLTTSWHLDIKSLMCHLLRYSPSFVACGGQKD